jgi:hypothetical protein
MNDVSLDGMLFHPAEWKIYAFHLHKNLFLEKKTFCRNNEFLCSNGESCIPQGWVCDRTKDCSDGSDELSCGGKQSHDSNPT